MPNKIRSWGYLRLKEILFFDFIFARNFLNHSHIQLQTLGTPFTLAEIC